MLQAAALCFDEVAIHRRRVIALLDQFDLKRPRIGERHRRIRKGRFTTISEVHDRHALGIEPGANADHASPVVHRRDNIRNDKAQLPDLSEVNTHCQLLCGYVIP